MDKKTILITGAASGIGRATALFFASKGWYTGLYDVNEPDLKRLGDEIGQQNCCFSRMDVSDMTSVKKGMEHFSQHTGGSMDILFNNAGIIRMGLLEEIPVEECHDVIDVNLRGVVNCISAGLPLLKHTGGSRIINMSSASSLYGTAYLAVYSATKAAVGSLTESLNLELDQYGVHVCDVRAPYVNTPLLNRDIKAPSIDNLGVKLSPEDVARTVWKASRGRKIHYDTRGVFPLLVLRQFPAFTRQFVLSIILLPRKKQVRKI